MLGRYAKNIMRLPTETELAGKRKPYCLDTEHMLKNFLNLTKDEAIELFYKEPVSEDFSYMMPIGLKFYLEAALDYLKGDKVATEEWGFPLGLLCSLHCQVSIFKIDRSVIPLIKEVSQYCTQHPEKLDIDVESGMVKQYIKSIDDA